MKWFVYLYPKSWRRQYGEELSELLEQTKWSLKAIVDLLLGVIDAWHVELSEKDLYGYRISQFLVLITLINIVIILKLKPLKEVVLVEQVATIAVLIAMSALFLAVISFVVSIFKLGVKEGTSLKSKLMKTSFGLMGVYSVFLVTFLVLIN